MYCREWPWRLLMDLGRQGEEKPRPAIIAIVWEPGRKLCAQHVGLCYYNKANVLYFSSVFFSMYYSIYTNDWFERHKPQWEDLKDSLKNVCIVHQAVTPLQMWVRGKKQAWPLCYNCTDDFVVLTVTWTQYIYNRYGSTGQLIVQKNVVIMILQLDFIDCYRKAQPVEQI